MTVYRWDAGAAVISAALRSGLLCWVSADAVEVLAVPTMEVRISPKIASFRMISQMFSDPLIFDNTWQKMLKKDVACVIFRRKRSRHLAALRGIPDNCRMSVYFAELIRNFCDMLETLGRKR